MRPHRTTTPPPWPRRRRCRITSSRLNPSQWARRRTTSPRATSPAATIPSATTPRITGPTATIRGTTTRITVTTRTGVVAVAGVGAVAAAAENQITTPAMIPKTQARIPNSPIPNSPIPNSPVLAPVGGEAVGDANPVVAATPPIARSRTTSPPRRGRPTLTAAPRPKARAANLLADVDVAVAVVAERTIPPPLRTIRPTSSPASVSPGIVAIRPTRSPEFRARRGWRPSASAGAMVAPPAVVAHRSSANRSSCPAASRWTANWSSARARAWPNSP